MKRINPFVGLFVAMATLMTAFFVPVFVLLIDHGERLAAVEAAVDAVQATQAEHGERLARVEVAIAALARDLAAVKATIEAMQADIDEMQAAIAAMQAAIAALAGDLAATNERMARIEGTVAGALGRPFPERMAETPANPGAGG